MKWNEKNNNTLFWTSIFVCVYTKREKNTYSWPCRAKPSRAVCNVIKENSFLSVVVCVGDRKKKEKILNCTWMCHIWLDSTKFLWLWYAIYYYVLFSPWCVLARVCVSSVLLTDGNEQRKKTESKINKVPWSRKKLRVLNNKIKSERRK